jgi:flagellar basal-body rod protein FlgB
MANGDTLFGLHGTALALRSQRLALLASNIANAATPNYKARDIDFDKALANASSGQSNIDDAARGNLGYRVPLETSLDGNTVELSTEQSLFAENAIKYRTTLSFLEGRIGTIMSALRGE